MKALLLEQATTTLRKTPNCIDPAALDDEDSRHPDTNESRKQNFFYARLPVSSFLPNGYFRVKVKPSPVVKIRSLVLVPDGGLVT